MNISELVCLIYDIAVIVYDIAVIDIAVILGALFAIVPYMRAKTRERKEHIMQILSLVGSEEQRKNRKAIYSAARVGKSRAQLNHEEYTAFESVSVAFDRIGMYAHYDKEFKKIVIDVHYDVLIRSWNASQHWIEDHVADYGRRHYSFYRELVDECKRCHPDAAEITAR